MAKPLTKITKNRDDDIVNFGFDLCQLLKKNFEFENSEKCIENCSTKCITFE